VRALRRLYTQARAATNTATVATVLHLDRGDPRKLAAAMLGAESPQVLVLCNAYEHMIDVNVFASVPGRPNTHIARTKFRRDTRVNRWARVLGRHCRHALGVLAYIRGNKTLADVFR
jgi:hypothetical protein